jgi:hypothetical protein
MGRREALEAVAALATQILLVVQAHQDKVTTVEMTPQLVLEPLAVEGLGL